MLLPVLSICFHVYVFSFRKSDYAINDKEFSLFIMARRGQDAGLAVALPLY